MSLILDALRKMEQERKARQGGTLDIRPEVLGHRRSAAPAKRRALPLLGGGLLLAVGLGLFLWKGGKQPTPPADLVARNDNQSATRPAITVPQPVAAPVAPVMPAPQPPAAMPAPAPTAESAPAVAAAPLPPPRPAPQPVQRHANDNAPAVAGGDGISVSGIAWQDERSLRRAVVNGSLLGEGAEVAGARIVEIGERRVKFSRGGQTFSVTLSSPFPAR